MPVFPVVYLALAIAVVNGFAAPTTEEFCWHASGAAVGRVAHEHRPTGAALSGNVHEFPKLRGRRARDAVLEKGDRLPCCGLVPCDGAAKVVVYLQTLLDECARLAVGRILWFRDAHLCSGYTAGMARALGMWRHR